MPKRSIGLLAALALPALLALRLPAQPPEPKQSADLRAPQTGSRGVLPPQREPVATGGSIPDEKRLYSVSPVYPPEAQQERISATVELQLTLNEKGEVYQARIVRGHPLLDKAALAAVYQWKYAPTLQNGKPVPITGTVKIIFKPRPSGIR
jgi:protein TonB